MKIITEVKVLEVPSKRDFWEIMHTKAPPAFTLGQQNTNIADEYNGPLTIPAEEIYTEIVKGRHFANYSVDDNGEIIKEEVVLGLPEDVSSLLGKPYESIDRLSKEVDELTESLREMRTDNIEKSNQIGSLQDQIGLLENESLWKFLKRKVDKLFKE